MPPRERADQVYQLTLTELAFVVIFLILLLTGWMIVRTDEEKAAALREKDEALSRLAESPDHRAAAERLEALRRAEQELRRILEERGMADPDAIVSELVRNAEVEGENRRLRKRIEDLDAQLTALEEIKKVVEESQNGIGGVEQLTKENRDLRAQAAWLRNQLDARGGRDYPPCWAEESTGKPQYLFTVALHEGGIAVDPAWPPERSGDAKKLPGLDGLVGAGILSVPTFKARLQGLDADSKAKKCRHYVRLVNRVGSLAAFNRQRYAVEEFFYKFEVR